MLRLPRATITSQDDVFQEIDQPDGLAVVTGESPGGTVKISVADRDAKKYRQVDRLTHASWKRRGDTWTFTGTSQYLSEEIGAKGDDAQLTFTVTPLPGCEDCG